jgi:Undecaprenyl-phosphate glucose phosphotransferase
VLKQRHQLFVSLLCGADAAAGALACYIAWGVRRWVVEGGLPALDDRGGLLAWVREPLALLALPILLVCLWSVGMYRPRRDSALIAECGDALKASLMTSVGLIVLMWAGGQTLVGSWSHTNAALHAGGGLDGHRFQMVLLAVTLPVVLIAQRMIFRLVLRAVRRRGWNQRHVLIIGTGRLGRITCRTLDRNSWTGLHVSHFLYHGEHLPLAKSEEGKAAERGVVLSRPVLGGLADLERVLEETSPDAVYLALPSKSAPVVPGVLRRLERFAVDVKIIPDVHPRYMPQSMAVGELEGMPILSIRENPMTGLSGILKSAVDIVGAIVALILFSPVMILAAAAVRFTSKGPVIFKQRRVSLGGEVFNIYKFRTMYHASDESGNEPDGPRWTARDDGRITRVGRWLRKTSMDELPQLFNVLVGDMSLVGPRPERPELIERFRDDWRGYMLRQHVKAGITGWAQVNGLRGDTSLRKRLQLDLFYIRHWSLGFDLKILWLTVLRGFVDRNAH